MRKYTKRAGAIVLCQIIVCSLLLAGCGLPDPEQTTGNAPEEERIKEPVTEDRSTGETLSQLIQDEGLRKIVKDAAGVKQEDTGEVLRQKLEQCEELILNRESVSDLAGLGALLPNLHSLVIDYGTRNDSQIEDFTPIAEFSHLEQLYIKYPAGKDMDFSFLAQMDTVTELFLVDCDLKDASFLLEMPQLECLSLYRTPVEDLAVLENLTGLAELALCGNRDAKNMETVGKLLNMQDLGLQDCGIEDISFLSGLTKLRGVNLNYNSVTDLTPLSDLTGLERLGLVGNEVSDIGPLAGLENLFDLALDGNQISDISALKNLPDLNQVGLSANQIRDLSPLADKQNLLYVSLVGNPCTDPGPVLTVPFLYFESGYVSEERLETVRDWMAEQRPEMEEYGCSDYMEADLNGDGLQDAAFLVDGEFLEGDNYAYNNEHHLFVLLKNRDGSWREVEHNIRIGDSIYGGMRGDPYRGMWMGEGYVLVKQESGSSSGTTETEVYRYRQGSLEPVWSIAVDDCRWEEGYDVRVYNENKLPTAMSGVAALECFRDFMEGDWEQEMLPYASWQKEGYELLKGVELPDYYYVNGDDYFYYYDLVYDGEEYHHVIRYVWDGSYHQDYRIKDSTGEVEEK